MWDKIVIIFNNWWSDPDTQMWLIQRPMRILVTLIVALVGQWIVSWAIKKFSRYQKEKPLHNFLPVRTAKEAEIADYEEKARLERKRARIDTLSSVARSTAVIVIWVWAALEILRNLGVNVAPLIASAGVVGLAIGFGAQSLVKDFLAGIFMLMEDQYGVGDTIDVGEVVGDVEEVTLRLTTLRDIDGTVWFVRNGQIERVGNFSQGYALARIDFPIGLKNDFHTAREAIEVAAKEAVQAEDIKPMVLDEPSVQGIVSVKPDHANIRISVKTLPGRQWAVQRRIYAEIFPKIQEYGITPPNPFMYRGNTD